MGFSTFNPYLEKEIANYEYDSNESIQNKLIRLQESQEHWQRLDPEARALRVRQLASQVEAAAEKLALQASMEMGKPLLQARAEVEKCVLALRTLADFAPAALRPRQASAQYKSTQVMAEPLGVILSIQPWNFPYWQILRMAACSWMAGNVILLKHANIVAGCADLLESVLNDGNAPLLLNSRMSHDQAALIMSSRRVNAVTFTGSTKGGRAVAQAAGYGLKKCVMELGGSDAYVVMADADLKLAASTCVKARLINSGQSCIAGKRFFVEHSIVEEFRKLFLDELSKRKAGDPLSEDTEIGPLASPQFVQSFEKQIKVAQESGAQFFEVAKVQKNFSSRGVLDFGTNLKGFEEEELFGPVAQFYRFQKLEDVIHVVNEGVYGLGGGIFTTNPETAKLASAQMKVGTFTVNSFVQSDPRVPFGGTRDSGFGREMGVEGLHDFVSWKVVGQS